MSSADEAPAGGPTEKLPVEVPGTTIGPTGKLDPGEVEGTTIGPTAKLPAPDVPGPTVLSGAMPAPVVPESSKPEPRGRRWRRRLLIVAGLGLLLLIFGPWLLTRTILTPAIRSQLGQGGKPGGLGRASLSYFTGVGLDRLMIPSPVDGAPPMVLLDGVQVDLGLVGAGAAAVFGGNVPAKLVVKPGRIVLTLPLPKKEGAEEPEPEPATEAAPEGESAPKELPCSLQPGLDVQRLDIAVRYVPPDTRASPLTFELRGLTMKGGGRIERDLAIDLEEGFAVAFEELRLDAERPEVLSTPVIVRGAKLEVPRLKLMGGKATIGERLTTSLRFTIPRLEGEGIVFTDLALELAVEKNQLLLSAQGGCDGGKIDLTLRCALTKTPAPEQGPGKLKTPMSVELELTDVDASGGLARCAPFLLPVLHATEVSSRNGKRPGLPALSLKFKGTLDLITAEDGGLLSGESLRTFSIPDGEVGLGRGSLAASRAIDGYARTLLGLGVLSSIDGVLPKGLAFGGGKGRFKLEKGTVEIPKLALRSDAVDLQVSAKVELDGPYELKLGALLDEGKPGPADPILKSFDAAGGLTVKGDLTKGESGLVAPTLEQVLQAAKSLGLSMDGAGPAVRDALERFGPR